jgi:hypothetical protein
VATAIDSASEWGTNEPPRFLLRPAEISKMIRYFL